MAHSPLFEIINSPPPVRHEAIWKTEEIEFPPNHSQQPRRSRRRTREGNGRERRREDWPTLSSLPHFSLRNVVQPGLSLSLTLSPSLSHSARRRRRRCRGRRGKKKRLNQEPECSEWELSRSSKGPAAATLRNIPTRIQFLGMKEAGREAGMSNQRGNQMVARSPRLINTGYSIRKANWCSTTKETFANLANLLDPKVLPTRYV